VTRPPREGADVQFRATTRRTVQTTIDPVCRRVGVPCQGVRAHSNSSNKSRTSWRSPWSPAKRREIDMLLPGGKDRAVFPTRNRRPSHTAYRCSRPSVTSFVQAEGCTRAATSVGRRRYRAGRYYGPGVPPGSPAFLRRLSLRTILGRSPWYQERRCSTACQSPVR